jgi:hypothetical protein
MASPACFSTEMFPPMSTMTLLLDVTLTVMNDEAPTGTIISSPSFAFWKALSASAVMVTSSRETRRTWTWWVRASTLSL